MWFTWELDVRMHVWRVYWKAESDKQIVED